MSRDAGLTSRPPGVQCLFETPSYAAWAALSDFQTQIIAHVTIKLSHFDYNYRTHLNKGIFLKNINNYGKFTTLITVERVNRRYLTCFTVNIARILSFIAY